MREQHVVRHDPGLDIGISACLALLAVGAAARGVDADVVAAELGVEIGERKKKKGEKEKESE